MGNLLFSPSGRISSADFMRGYTLVIVISLVIQLLTIFIPALAALGIVSLVLFWCMIVLWIKRYHDGGKSGWMCLLPIIVSIIVGIIASMILSKIFVDPAYADRMAEAAQSGDFGSIFASASKGGMTTMGAIISAIVGAAISYAIAVIFNGTIKSDPHDNQFGPATPSV